MSKLRYGSPEWGDALSAWRTAYWQLGRKSLDAHTRRGEQEFLVRRMRKELAAAEADLIKRTEEATDLQRQVDEMLEQGKAEEFSP